MRRGWMAITGLACLAASLVVQRRVLPDLAGTAIGRTSADPTGFTWWLGHTVHELSLVTDLQHYPAGVNAMWNTSVPLLGVLLAPVTLTAGATAAFNVGMILGPVASGLATAAALGGIVRSRVGRALAGGMYAFSPFMIAHLQAGHLNLVWAVFPPVLLALAHRLFVRELRRPWLLGALTGLVCALQAVLYPQTLALGILMLVVLAVVLAALYPRRALDRLLALARAGLACVVVFGVLAAYPLYLVVAGPVRPQAPIRAPDYGSADLANTLEPTWLTLVRPVLAPLSLQGNLGEQGGYLGWAVLALVVVAVLTCGIAARVAALVGAVAWVLALGAQLYLDGRPVGVDLPWRVLLDLPLLAEIEPVRLQVVVALAVAVLAGLAVDRAVVPARAGSDLAAGPRRLAAPPYVGSALLALVVAAAVSWLPADAQRTTVAAAPAYPELAGQVVETWPRITSDWYGGPDPLRAQLASDFGYRLIGGYFIGSDADHPVLIESPWNAFQAGAALAERPWLAPPVDPAAAARELRAAGVTRVLVTPRPGADPGPVLDWTRRVTGSEPVPLRGAWAFTLQG